MPNKLLKKEGTREQIQIDKCVHLVNQVCTRSDEEIDNLRNTEYALEKMLNSFAVNYYVQNKDRYKDELNQDSYYWENSK